MSIELISKTYEPFMNPKMSDIKQPDVEWKYCTGEISLPLSKPDKDSVLQ